MHSPSQYCHDRLHKQEMWNSLAHLFVMIMNGIIIIIIIIIIFVRHELGLDTHLPASSNILFQGLPSRLVRLVCNVTVCILPQTKGTGHLIRRK